MLQWLTELWNNFAQDIIQVLPMSPFRPLINQWSTASPQGLSWLNWLIDIPGILTIFFAWLTCYGIYLIASIILRWLKAVE